MFKKKIKILNRLKWFYLKHILKKKFELFKIKEFEIYLDLLTPGISKTLAIYESREDDMKHIIKDKIRYGMNIIDCGSNIGFYPLFERKLIGNHGKIYSFEPDQRNFTLLDKNIKLFDKSNNTFIYKQGLAEKKSLQNFIITNESNLNTISSGNDDKFLSKYKIDDIHEINCTSVDEFISDNEIKKIDFIRMDIEGYEVEVLKGMKKTLNNMKPSILIETHPHFYDENRSFTKQLQYLFRINYKVKLIISAVKPQPEEFKKLNLKPDKIINSDFVQRGLYKNVSNENVIKLVNFLPKVVRYIYLEV